MLTAVNFSVDFLQQLTSYPTKERENHLRALSHFCLFLPLCLPVLVCVIPPERDRQREGACVYEEIKPARPFL